MRSTIFISHRTDDSEIADMIKDFLVNTGIPNDKIFCSSLPGNDVVGRIPVEVKDNLKKCIILILILSKNYYESAFCLNEAGIAWYLEDEVDSIAVCLPEIDQNSMYGFFDGNNKVRRLDNENDVAAIYDLVSKRLNSSNVSHSVIVRETQKLSNRYAQYIANRIDVSNDESSCEKEMDYQPVVGMDDVGKIPLESAFLLVYAAAGDGKILKINMDNAPPYITVMGNREFMTDMSSRESARWVEALDRLIDWGWVKASYGSTETFALTGTGYKKADWLKENMSINTNNEPLDELKEFDN